MTYTLLSTVYPTTEFDSTTGDHITEAGVFVTTSLVATILGDASANGVSIHQGITSLTLPPAPVAGYIGRNHLGPPTTGGPWLYGAIADDDFGSIYQYVAPTPPDTTGNWTYIGANAGPAGPTGATGPTGPQGPAGPSGAGFTSMFRVTDSAYGAVGDGTTDDTAAIQAAINAAGGSGLQGGVVYFPATTGGYLISSALILDIRVRLVGDNAYQFGRSSRLKAKTGGTFTNGPIADSFMLKTPDGRVSGNPPFSYWHGGSIENLALDCNSQAVGGMHGWYPGENSLIDRMSVYNTGTGHPGVQFEGGAATGFIRSLAGQNNGGPLLHLKNQATGSWQIDVLEADDNTGGALLVESSALALDPVSVVIDTLKTENKVAAGRMDPVITLSNCDMVSLQINGGSVLTSYAQTDVVRIDSPQNTGPAVTLHGLEGANPFNTGYTNILRNTATGETVPAGFESRYYPVVFYNRSVVLAGKSTVPALDVWQSRVTFDAQPTSGTWSVAYEPAALYTLQGYNTAGAQNDAATWPLVLSKGTWRLDLAALKATNAGIVTFDLSFDGGSTFPLTIGTFDGYTAGSKTAAVASFSGLAVPATGKAVLRMRVLTKNASSSQYFALLSAAVFTRTV